MTKRPDGTEVVAHQATLRAATIARARAELARGVREDAGPNRDKAGRIAAYLAGCARHGMWLELGPSPWCAAFVSFCVWMAMRDGNFKPPSFAWRASVAELCQDAKEVGDLHVVGDGYDPQPGDLAVYGRDGQSPLRGGLGHVGVATGEGTAICGNDRDAVRESGIDRGPGMPLLAWISLEGA